MSTTLSDWAVQVAEFQGGSSHRPDVILALEEDASELLDIASPMPEQPAYGWAPSFWFDGVPVRLVATEEELLTALCDLQGEGKKVVVIHNIKEPSA